MQNARHPEPGKSQNGEHPTNYRRWGVRLVARPTVAMLVQLLVVQVLTHYTVVQVSIIFQLALVTIQLQLQHLLTLKLQVVLKLLMVVQERIHYSLLRQLL